MLVLSRKKNERVCIAPNIEVAVVEIRGDKVRLGFSAPVDVVIDRSEVADAKARGGVVAVVAEFGWDPIAMGA